MEKTESKRVCQEDDVAMADNEAVPSDTGGKKRPRKSGVVMEQRIDLADSARSHFTTEGIDTETTPLYLTLKSTIEKLKAEVVVMLLRIITKNKGLLSRVAEGSLQNSSEVAAYI